MDARNRDELLKKKETLEAYLLENPRSSLFAWYARQNMEAGELDRALKICKLGLMEVEDKGVIHKLLGEIYMARGEVTQAMKHLVECILTREPFPGVIIEVVKNLGDTMEAEQIAFLVHLLNKALPGHPDATKFYKKYPSARNMQVQPGQYKILEELALSLERSAMVEVLPLDEEEELAIPLLDMPQALTPEPPAPWTTSSATRTQPEAPISFEQDDPAEVVIPMLDPQTVAATLGTARPAVDMAADSSLPEPAEAPKTPEKPRPRQSPAVKHNITRSMATFTLMQIFKDQGMYENAMEVLLFLKEKSSNIERIEAEEKEIREIMAQNGIG